MSRRKRKFTVCFEFGLGGLVGLATVCLCIFLWLFLLGVWAGQTVLLPSADSDSGQALESFARDLWQRGRQSIEPANNKRDGQSAIIETQAKSKVKPLAVEDEEEEPSFFTLQVATFDVESDAKEEVLRWQAKGFDSFFLPPMEGADYFRVFIGHFATLSAANDKVNSLDGTDVQAFITLLPAQNIGR